MRARSLWYNFLSCVQAYFYLTWQLFDSIFGKTTNSKLILENESGSQNWWVYYKLLICCVFKLLHKFMFYASGFLYMLFENSPELEIFVVVVGLQVDGSFQKWVIFLLLDICWSIPSLLLFCLMLFFYNYSFPLTFICTALSNWECISSYFHFIFACVFEGFRVDLSYYLAFFFVALHGCSLFFSPHTPPFPHHSQQWFCSVSLGNLRTHLHSSLLFPTFPWALFLPSSSSLLCLYSVFHTPTCSGCLSVV